MFNITQITPECIQLAGTVVNRAYSDNMLPLAILVGVLALGLVAFALIASQQYRDQRLMKDFMRRKKLLNEYEDWKRERSIQ